MILTDELSHKAKPITLLILDVDGVLTDNRLYYSDNGIETKTFHTRDGHGMVMLQKSQVDIGIITGRDSPLVAQRMQDLKVKYVYQGVPDKLPTFLKLVDELEIDMNQIAYVGDDILDLPIQMRVGFSVAPANADKEVLKRVDFISSFEGGQGCVREVCEIIMRAQGSWQQQLDFYLRDLP